MGSSYRNNQRSRYTGELYRENFADSTYNGWLWSYGGSIITAASKKRLQITGFDNAIFRPESWQDLNFKCTFRYSATGGADTWRGAQLLARVQDIDNNLQCDLNVNNNQVQIIRMDAASPTYLANAAFTFAADTDYAVEFEVAGFQGGLLASIRINGTTLINQQADGSNTLRNSGTIGFKDNGITSSITDIIIENA